MSEVTAPERSVRPGRGITARMILAVAIVAPAFIAAIIVLAVAIHQLRSSADTARVAERNLRLANQVQALVVDAETAIRGFTITHREVFLDPLRESQAQLPGVTSELESTPFDTAQSADLGRALASMATDYVQDYAAPLEATIRDNPTRGRQIITSAAGKRRVDAIRSTIAEFARLQQASIDAAAAAAASNADRATTLAISAAIAAVLLLLGLVLFLARSIAVPLRRTALAAARLGSGDLSVRVEEGRSDELGDLAQAFNGMAFSLEQSSAEIDGQHTELENQNAELERQAVEMESQTVELEAQAAELEAGQQEITDANASLVQRSLQLEMASEALRKAHGRVELFARVGDGFSRRTGLQDRALTLLTSTGDAVHAPIGVVYARAATGSDVPLMLASRGIDGDLGKTPLGSGQGLAGRALAERTTITVEHGDGDLRLMSFGKEVWVRHEVHAPLIYGDRVIGVLSLGRTGGGSFTDDEIGIIEHLAEQGAVALDNSMQSERAAWLASLNRAVLDAAVDAIHLSAPDGSTVITNPAMDRFRRDVLHVPADGEMTDRAAAQRGLGARTADPQAYAARIKELDEHPEMEAVDEFELKDTGRWVHRYTAPAYTDSGQLIGRIWVMRETTDQREAQRVKDELMATVSHELRTPLSAILGFAELLMARDYDRDERREHLGTIHTQASRLSMLINDFLDLQRLEQSNEGIDLRPIELDRVIEQQVSLFAAQSDTHELEVKADEHLAVLGDEDRLGRALANLLSNAIKYSPSGGPVTVEATRQNGDVVLSVADQGLGIPAEEQARVFDRFYRVDSSATRSIGGTGLGLALVREIAHAHGGDVGFESVEGRGSRFWITVPADETA